MLFLFFYLFFLVLTISVTNTPIEPKLVSSLRFLPFTTPLFTSLHVTLPLIPIAAGISYLFPQGTGNTIWHARLQL